MRTILYVSALTLALSSPALAEMHGGGGGHGHGGRFFGGGVGYACTPLQLAAGYCGYGY